MFAPGILFLLSASALVVAFTLPGWADLVMIAGPATVASLYLLLRAIQTRGKGTAWVILDGSNVMYWRDNTPELDTVRAVLKLARRSGMTPGVIFDANAGHLLFGKYVDDRDFAGLLKLPKARALVVPRGEPADPTILEAARSLGARIITNDRYRDWVEDFPELKDPGRLIRGGYRDGTPWLDLGRGDGGAKKKRRPERRRSKRS